MRTIVQVVLGYMYKVMKNGMDTKPFASEFAAIRHGDYEDFVNQIGKPIDFIVSYSGGRINTDTSIGVDDSDFGRLLKSGESLMVFFKECKKTYGQIVDNDIPDEVYERVALFELSIRMHKNNSTRDEDRVNLVDIIDTLGEIKGLSEANINALQEGRKFLNYVKRPEKLKYTWVEGIQKFNDAYDVLKRNQLTIC